MKRCALFAKVRRFCGSEGAVLRATTHRSLEDPQQKKETATSFLASLLPRIHQANQHEAFIVNMDQTPHNPRDTAKRTVARRGSKTVNGKEIKTSVGRITACLSVCADGTKLEPLLVCKAKPTGTVRHEFAKNNCPNGAKCIAQENAWCDERVMPHWIDNVLWPCVQKAPPGVIPCLLLDKCTCHCQGSAAKAIEDLGVEWDILPGGCTGLTQPTDVGTNKPWKN